MSQQFILDILSAGGGGKIEDIADKISDVNQFINSYQHEIKQDIEEASRKFFPFTKENDKLQNKAEKLYETMKSLDTSINENVKIKIQNTTEELKERVANLQQTKLYLQLVNHIINLDEKLKLAEKQIETKDLYLSALTIEDATIVLNNLKDEADNLLIIKPLQEELTLTREKLKYTISNIWRECVFFERNDDENSYQICFTIKINRKQEIVEALKAAYSIGYVVLEDKFTAMLLNDIFKPITLYKTIVRKEIQDNFINIVTNINIKETPTYAEVLENLSIIVSVLKEYLNIKIAEDIYFIEDIGEKIRPEFTYILIQNCLSTTIPSSSEDLKSYANVIDSVTEFQTTLQICKFLPKNCDSLLDYAKNVNVLFANKFCQVYLVKARNIMKKDLHETITLEDYTIKLEDIYYYEQKWEQIHQEILIDYQENPDDGILLVPGYQISQSSEELLHLVESAVTEIEQSQEMCGVRLFYTIRNIFEMYSALVPLHHKKFLETLPQQTALFYNNCVYFSHQLLTLYSRFKFSMASIPQSYSDMLVEQALVLNKLANNSLEVYVAGQKSQIIYILRDSGLATLNEHPKLNVNTEKSIRQCLRQLQLLQTVWRHVLPNTTYSETLGTLLNAFLEEIILLILKVEDIHSDTANDMVTMFTTILEKTPELFHEPKQVHRLVKSWHKFKEFVGLLDASMKDINDRWADGMGPLAIEFTPEELRKFVRALFQNNERRAALLARIR